MINPINSFDLKVKRAGKTQQAAIGSQPLRSLSFQGNNKLDSKLLKNAKSAYQSGASLLPTGALGHQKAVNGTKGANLNLFA